jgi:hypothetical protein
MMSKTELMFAPDVVRLIHSVRNQRIILDADLAGLYGVPTKRLNEQYRRNLDRFPADFAFQLTLEEWAALRSQIAALTSDPNLKSQIATSSLSHGGAASCLSRLPNTGRSRPPTYSTAPAPSP